MWRFVFFVIISTTFLSCNTLDSGTCKVPGILLEKIAFAAKSQYLSEDEFYAINNMLYDFEVKDSLRWLINCGSYQQYINELFNSDDIIKRVLSYRLIGVANDTTYNSELINRINSDESALLKTWSAHAIMMNKVPNSSDHLFKLLTSAPEGLPVSILINQFVAYDITGVKETGWKFIDSDKRIEQIFAIQVLSSFQPDKRLQNKLLEFLGTWDIQSIGWVISAMSQQKMGDLKPLLEQYSKSEDLRDVVIEALESSPSKTDNQFAKELMVAYSIK